MTNCQLCGQIIITVRVQSGESSHQARVVRTAFRETEPLKMNRICTEGEARERYSRQKSGDEKNWRNNEGIEGAK